MAASWGDIQTATPLATIVQVEQIFDVTPQMGPDQYAHVIVGGTGNNTTDNLSVAIYGSLDGATWTNIAASSFSITGSTSAQLVDIIVRDLYQFQIGVTSSGATTTFSATMNVKIATV